MFAAKNIRAWIKANLTGSDEDFRGSTPPQSEEEKLRQTMDDQDFMPPDLFPAEGGVNKKAVEFWVKKLIDLATCGIVAAFTWLGLRLTGRHLLPEKSKTADVVETLAPAVVWAACFLRLTLVRRREAKTRTRAPKTQK